MVFQIFFKVIGHYHVFVHCVIAHYYPVGHRHRIFLFPDFELIPFRIGKNHMIYGLSRLYFPQRNPSAISDTLQARIIHHLTHFFTLVRNMNEKRHPNAAKCCSPLGSRTSKGIFCLKMVYQILAHFSVYDIRFSTNSCTHIIGNDSGKAFHAVNHIFRITVNIRL